MGRTRRSLTGLQRRGDKWRAVVRVNGTLHVSPWGQEPMADLKTWRDDQVEKFGGTPEAVGGLAEKVGEYLKRKASMPTIKQHTAHLALWVHELGANRPPLSVTSEEIDIILQDWLERLSKGTVRKRRSALRSFYSKTYPKKLNPVKGSANPKPPKPEAREIPFAAIEAAIAAMPTYRDTKKGLPRRMNKSKIRVRVMAYTGIPPGLLQTVTRHDLSLVAGTVRIVGREKGEGIEPRTLDLSDEALEAFKDFHTADCYGYFAIESCNRAFKRGARRAGLDPKSVHQYDLRHSFLSQVYRVTRDRSTVERLGLHAEGSVCSARYTKGANREVDAAAVAAFSASLALQRQQALKAATAPRVEAAAVSSARRKLPRKVTSIRKAS